MSVLMAATLRSRGTPAVHVFADRVIATDDRHGSRPPRPRSAPASRPTRSSVPCSTPGRRSSSPASSAARRTARRRPSAAAAPTTAPRCSAPRSTPTRSRSGPTCPASSPPTRARSPTPASSPTISYDEAQELAHFGAKVLHPRTIRPAVALDIPVRILSTFAPEEPGTLVTRAGDRRPRQGRHRPARA